jgi:hypothetical protein
LSTPLKNINGFWTIGCCAWKPSSQGAENKKEEKFI